MINIKLINPNNCLRISNLKKEITKYSGFIRHKRTGSILEILNSEINGVFKTYRRVPLVLACLEKLNETTTH